MENQEDSLEGLIQKAQTCQNRFEDWNYIMEFCEKVSKDKNNILPALKTITQHLQSENDETQMLALIFLEASAKNCGVDYINEIAKFRFLNEMIKLISPKYNSSITTESVQNKVRQLLFNWRQSFTAQTKIQEAFEMLKKEGLIDDDGGKPKLPEPLEVDNRESIIKSADDHDMLQKLLSSKNPGDLEKANKFIQDKFKKESIKHEKIQHRHRELELVQNNAKLLDELLAHYNITSSSSERDLIDELKRSCLNMREKLLKVAEQSSEDDELLAKICTNSDRLAQVLEKYDTVVTPIDTQRKKLEIKQNDDLIKQPNSSNGEILDSLLTFDNVTQNSHDQSINKSTTVDSMLGSGLDELLNFGSFYSSPADSSNILQPLQLNSIPTLTPNLDELLLLNDTQTTSSPLMNSLPLNIAMPKEQPMDINTIQITQSSLICSTSQILTPYFKNNILITVSPAKLANPSNLTANLKAIVVSFINLSPYSVSDYFLKIAASKDTKLKLFQPPQTSLMPFNPFQTVPHLAQILILQNQDFNVAFKFHIEFIHGNLGKFEDIFELQGIRWV